MEAHAFVKDSLGLGFQDGSDSHFDEPCCVNGSIDLVT